ncbi:putative small acidic protein 1-like [Capsicum annuum]|nr:putative small acidic protein 1-like [Capsicum annuum]
MATLQTNLHFPISYSPRFLYFKNPNSLYFSKKLFFSKKVNGVFSYAKFGAKDSFFCCCKASGEILPLSSAQKEEIGSEERPPFDINLAVILAGFAFEAYTSPPDKVGRQEVDGANCKTIFLSEPFVREIYDGQLFIKLKKGLNLPAMDLWGTSDPYVVLQLDSQVVKSKVKWGTKEPTWNEEFALNIKQPPLYDLQLAAWDANLVAPHKRMGNAAIHLEHLCDGDSHELLVDLEGMGGGGKIEIEIKYKSFEKIEEEKKWWNIPIITEFLKKNGFESALKAILGSETVQARQFVQYAFGQLKLLNDAYDSNSSSKNSNSPVVESDVLSESQKSSNLDYSSMPPESEFSNNLKNTEVSGESDITDEHSSPDTKIFESSQSDKHFWKNFADTVNQNVVQRLGLPAPEKIKWDNLDLLNKIGLQSRKDADAGYVESGLATPDKQENVNGSASTEQPVLNNIQSSLPDIKKVTQDLLRQTDSILGALVVLNATVSQFNKGAGLFGKGNAKEDSSIGPENDILGYPMNKDGIVLDEKKAEEMKSLFSTAETAMEAWALLATSLGHPTFIKSEFDKLCFLDNKSTDTEASSYIAGFEFLASIRFLRSDLFDPRKAILLNLDSVRAADKMEGSCDGLDASSCRVTSQIWLNPERIGGDFKEEVQVHSGFLSAYDSVRIRLISLIKKAIDYRDDDRDLPNKWHVYVTGHSLGGALATLLALELSSSQLAKRGAIRVTMYNFGSPRVGNKKFAEVYNEKVKDSWRVVNHRDIIPTVPRLMGYCHVAQPVYLAAGDLKNTRENVELLEDGYQGDVIGEATPDVIVSEFMKGEKELIEKILNTEINIFLAIRDGSALMQHMEDFYYITLLENVRSNYRTVARPQMTEG